MIAVDANVLVCAHRGQTSQHERALERLRKAQRVPLDDIDLTEITAGRAWSNSARHRG